MPRAPAFALLLALMSASLPAQQPRRSLLAEGGAGLYQGSPSSHNGPIFFVRLLRPVGNHWLLGARAEYRDDDRDGGRARALGVGLEAAYSFPLDIGGTLYLPVSLGVEHRYLSDSPSSGEPDGNQSARARASAGVGFGVPAGPVQLGIEVRRSVIPPAFTSATLGIRSRDRWIQGAVGAVRLYASRLFPAGEEYRREPDSDGYGIAFQMAVDSLPPVDELRADIGIDYLQHGSVRTDVTHLFVGGAIDLVRTELLRVQVVPEVGAVIFGGGNRSGNGGFRVGAEGSVGWSGIRATGGVGVMMAPGPEGLLAARQVRIGVAVGM